MSYPWLAALEAELAERLQSGRIAHAFLVCGPAGTGKRDLAGRFMACCASSTAIRPAEPAVPAVCCEPGRIPTGMC